jgi:hypothetical protein
MGLVKKIHVVPDPALEGEKQGASMRADMDVTTRAGKTRFPLILSSFQSRLFPFASSLCYPLNISSKPASTGMGIRLPTRNPSWIAKNEFRGSRLSPIR